MLLIAMPKSASTSLMHTLGMSHQTKYTMHFEWDGPLVAGHDAYHKQHNFGWELNEDVVEFLSEQDMLFKIHIFPSENNLFLLKNIKKVVLLRNPSDIVQAYRRGQETGVYHSRLDVFENCVTPEEWHGAAVSAGLFYSLECFYKGWKQEKNCTLHVDFDELVKDTKTEINKIESFWGLPLSSVQSLQKRKYTRKSDDLDALAVYKDQEFNDNSNPLMIKGKWMMPPRKSE